MGESDCILHGSVCAVLLINETLRSVNGYTLKLAWDGLGGVVEGAGRGRKTWGLASVHTVHNNDDDAVVMVVVTRPSAGTEPIPLIYADANL